MDKNIGNYITQGCSIEAFKSYVPPRLQPAPKVDLTQLYPLLEKANIAIAELNSVHQNIPSLELFIQVYLRKEALLSSQIEGTQSTFTDIMLFEYSEKPDVAIEDVEEVSNYVKAVNFGLKRIKEGFPLSLRLIREIHAILLSGGRGVHKLPGEFRRSQNWIGGTRPGNALYVPPPVEELNACLSDFEKFLYDESLPTLINIGIAHVQFESIHPFLDGNGRIGRLLITLILCIKGFLDKPILYLSLYFKQNLKLYYDLLQEVRIYGKWEPWLEFFLNGIYIVSKQAIKASNQINELFANDLSKINKLGRARFSCQQCLHIMQKLPKLTVPILSRILNISQPTARTSLNKMADLNILEKTQDKKKNKIYIYKNYLNILEFSTIN